MTQSEWIHEQIHMEVMVRGERNPDKAWICSDYDTWERNPFYVGKPVPHPETCQDYEDDGLIEVIATDGTKVVLSAEEQKELIRETLVDDEIPF